MSFKNFLNELYEIEVGQAHDAHEPNHGPNPDQSSSVFNPEVMAKINIQLATELSQRPLTAHSGFQKIRKVLHSFSLDIPSMYGINPEGDEIVFEVTQFGKAFGPTPSSTEFEGDEEAPGLLYILYYLTDAGYYDFYAEVSDDVDYIDSLLEDGIEENDEE